MIHTSIDGDDCDDCDDAVMTTTKMTAASIASLLRHPKLNQLRTNWKICIFFSRRKP